VSQLPQFVQRNGELRQGDSKLLLEHLEELRKRLVLSLVLLAGGFIVCFWKQDCLIQMDGAVGLL